MCKGVEQEEPPQLAVEQRRRTDKKTAVGGGGEPVACELCGSRASMYCQADEAYLCGKCDKSVHGANFLAQRHVRCLLCSPCQSHSQRYLLGTSMEMEILLPSIVRSLVERNYRNYPCHPRDFEDNLPVSSFTSPVQGSFLSSRYAECRISTKSFSASSSFGILAFLPSRR
ncbi:B-box domain protein 30-like [Cucurbita maxima]|uniref:B-box domain protein 30-like n=1 Tax=Cucurbita maxima TaxID=3661 RepID=A0A6J1JQG3_CUCMA|nr:B-box domain protein 30-like [Cucurbita maxima]